MRWDDDDGDGVDGGDDVYDDPDDALRDGDDDGDDFPLWIEFLRQIFADWRVFSLCLVSTP